MKPIKRLSFKRFYKIMESFPNGVRFGRINHVGWEDKYSITIEDGMYGIYKNNGQFMEWFFDIGMLGQIHFRYFAELVPGIVQKPYVQYNAVFEDTTNLLTLSKKLCKKLPEKAKWTLDDFDEFLSEFVHFIESGGHKDENGSTG